MDSTPAAVSATRHGRSRPQWHSRLRGEAPPVVEQHDGVEVVDLPAARVHALADLLAATGSFLGIAVVLALGVYAHGTTVGVTEDVQAITKVINSLLSIAVSVLGGLVSVVLPVGVLVRLMMRRRVRRSVEAIAAMLLGYGLALVFAWVLERGAGQVWHSLTITTDNATVAATSPFATGLAAMLVLAGPRGVDGWIRWSWNLLWLSLGVEVITGALTLPGALVSLWLGTFVGWGLRYLLGSRPDRAYGADLVRAIRQTGLSPTRVVRVLAADAMPGGSDPARVAADDDPAVAGGSPLAGGPAGNAPVDAADDDAWHRIRSVSAPSALAVAAHSGARVYAVWSGDERAQAVLFDTNQRVAGLLERAWQAVRVRGLAAGAPVSLHQATEHTALIDLIARQAGVTVPRVIGLGEQAGSMVIAQQHLDAITTLRDLPPAEVTDELVAAIWRQVLAAQRACLAHGAISADVVLVVPGTGRSGWVSTSAGRGPDGGAVRVGDEVAGEPGDQAEVAGEPGDQAEVAGEPGDPPGAALIGWDNGALASQDLALRIDLAQTLAMIALIVGAPRAVASASAVLGRDQLARLGPLLQTVALPRETRADAKAKRQIMADLRAELAEEVPALDTTPMPLRRFSLRTVLTTTMVVVAAWVLLATMNFNDIVSAVQSANPWWLVAVFVFGLLPYLGASLELVAFCPEKLPVWRTTLVQLAASVVALVAPAAVGPAALNLTYLRRRKVSTPLAVASVALAQVMLFITTVVLLVIVALATGDFSALTRFPRAAMIVVLVIVALVGAALAIPAVRIWVWGKIGPTLRQVWPRLVWVLGQPRRLVVGLIGTTIHSIGYVIAFWAACEAFGIRNIPFTTLAIVYLLGNTVGSALPTPGGAGTVELSLTAGLVSAGVARAVAASVAVLFRAVTFWLMAPIGYVALRYVRRTGDV